MSHIVLPPRASPSMVQHAHEDLPPSPAPAPVRRPPRQLITAWMLFLLNRQATHGYELHRQLAAHGMSIELGAMYRTLRKLEDDGCAASSWATSVAGPRRRLYELTTKGRRELNALVQAITATRDVHAAFLRAHGETAR